MCEVGGGRGREGGALIGDALHPGFQGLLFMGHRSLGLRCIAFQQAQPLTIGVLITSAEPPQWGARLGPPPPVDLVARVGFEDRPSWVEFQVFSVSGSRTLMPGPAASVSPGNLLGGPLPEPPESGGGGQPCGFSQALRRSQVHILIFWCLASSRSL